MLTSNRIVAFAATRDPKRAKAFYSDTLGLKLVSEDPFALVFDVHGTMLRVTSVGEFTPHPFTVLGWETPDIASDIKNLVEAGVKFERFPGMKQNDLGVWTAPSGGKIAWFKDPDGNTLSLTEF
jgi:catechol 2,3-dioxygenase-like lactoylglutathione lyase family enzyme